jgi:hypothetical protein
MERVWVSMLFITVLSLPHLPPHISDGIGYTPIGFTTARIVRRASLSALGVPYLELLSSLLALCSYVERIYQPTFAEPRTCESPMRRYQKSVDMLGGI